MKKHNINLITNKKSIKLIDEKNKIYLNFESLTDASKWIISKNLSNTNDVMSIVSNLRKSILRKGKAYGFVWECNEYSSDQKNTFIKKTAEQDILKYKKTKIKCPLCGNLMDKTSEKCNDCNQKQKPQEGLIHIESTYNINRNKLKYLIRTMSFLKIGKLYGITDNGVRRWCKAYNLPFKSAEIKKYSKEEWECI